MALGSEYWLKREFLTIEQAAIFIVGGNPESEKFVTKNIREISSIASDLATAVRNDKEIIRKLIASGHNSIEDKLYDFKDICDEYGVEFFESLKINDFAVLDENIHPTIESIKLSVKEIKSWLIRHEIGSLFSIPEKSEKELHPKERTSMLTIILALCKQLKIDPEDRGIAVAIEAMIDSHGLKLSQDTIRTIFQQIPDVLEKKGKP